MAPAVAGAQGLLIAPNAVVIESKTKSGAVTLVNTGDRAVEASFATTYGYPVTDSLGVMLLKTFDTTTDTMPSAANWIQIYPQRLVLPAGARRTVRIMVSPPKTLKEGEYWARLVVTSRELAAPLIPVETDGVNGAPRADMQIGLSLEIRSVLGMFYRNGAVRTGVALENARATMVGDSLVTRTNMLRSGNAAFVGSLKVQLRDSTNALKRERMLPLGVYYGLDPRVALSVAGLPAGRYTVSFEAVSARPDVADYLLLPIGTARNTVAVRLP